MIDVVLAAVGRKLLDKAAEQLAAKIFPHVDDVVGQLRRDLGAEFDAERMSWLGAGRDLINWGRFNQAVPVLALAKNREPNSPLARLFLAVALAGDGNVDAGGQELVEALAMNPYLIPQLTSDMAGQVQAQSSGGRFAGSGPRAACGRGSVWGE